jgi:hypothetical protein
MSGLFNNLIWFVGVVEDRQDLTNAGRVRVRAFGIHPPKGEALPTHHLPWATVLDGSYGAAEVIPKVGDWVFGFFIDGREAQHPMVMGRIPGMNLSFPAGSGQPGEDGYIPPESLQDFGAPPLHRYVSGEDAEFGQAILQRAFKREDISMANDDTFDEPDIMTPERNLDNRVIKSKNGDNFLVLCDPVENEGGDFILLSHSSGSVFQIDPNGTIFVKSFGDTYNSTEGLEFNNIMGSQHTNIKEDWTLKVETGSGKVWINGDLDIECENFNLTARNTVNIKSAIKANISGGSVGIFATSDDINLVAYDNIKNMSGNPLNGGGFYVQSLFGDVHVDSYKMNLYSTAYTKIASLGTPAISTQTIPYEDVTHKGVEINSPVLVSLTSLGTVAISATAAASIHSLGVTNVSAVGKVDVVAGATLNLNATGVTSLDGSLVNVGMGTLETSGTTLAAVTALRGPQVALASALPSITERATAVNPGNIPPSRPSLFGSNFLERQNPPMTSFMGHGDDSNTL